MYKDTCDDKGTPMLGVRSVLALSKRILMQFRHDPRTVVMFVVAPVLVLWLFSVILSSNAYLPRLVAVSLPQGMEVRLAENDAIVLRQTAAEAKETLDSGQADAVISIGVDGTLDVMVEGSNASHTNAAIATVNIAMKEYAAEVRDALPDETRDGIAQAKDTLETLGQMSKAPSITELNISYLHGSSEWSAFDFLGPAFLGIFLFVFVFLTSGMSLLTERTSGTLARLLSTPIKPWQFVLGFCLGFGLVSLVQAIIVLWGCISLVGFPNEGQLLAVVCVTFLLAMVSLTLGLMVSGLAKTPFQVIQLMLLFVVPQILLSGIFDLAQAPGWLRVLSSCLPLTHGTSALRAIMLRGVGIGEVAPNLAILCGFIVAFFCAAALTFKRRNAS